MQVTLVFIRIPDTKFNHILISMSMQVGWVFTVVCLALRFWGRGVSEEKRSVLPKRALIEILMDHNQLQGYSETFLYMHLVYTTEDCCV